MPTMGPLQSFWTAWAIRYETAGNYGMAHECAIHARHYRNEGK